MNSVEIIDYNELLAIHRALLELKSIENPSDPAVIGSKFIADFANRVLDAIIDADRNSEKPERGESWLDWRSLDSTRREWPLIARQIGFAKSWPRMTHKQRQDFVRMLASPFMLSRENMEKLISEGDAFHSSEVI